MTIVLQHKVRHPGLCVHNTRCDTGDRCRVTRCGSVDYCATQTVTPSTMHWVLFSDCDIQNTIFVHCNSSRSVLSLWKRIFHVMVATDTIVLFVLAQYVYLNILVRSIFPMLV